MLLVLCPPTIFEANRCDIRQLMTLKKKTDRGRALAGYRAPTVFGCGHVAQEQQHVENML